MNSKELYMYINYYILTNDIKCISIDLWGTLISDNMLELNKMKTNILKCKINDIDKRIHFDIRLAKCKNICKCMERDGIVCSGLDKITYFFAGMLEEKYCGEILHRIELIEMSFPIVVNVELLQWLLYWKKRGKKVLIISNTGIISATATRYLLLKYGIYYLFDDIILSEEFGVGKPDENIFFHGYKGVKARLKESIHIGDNLYYDIIPLKKVGIKNGFLINF